MTRPPSTPYESRSAQQIQSLAALIAADLPGADEDQERLQTAFAYGVIDSLDDPDGIPRVEAELHARAFVSAPGGWRDEQILAGDPIAPLSGAAAPTSSSGSRGISNGRYP